MPDPLSEQDWEVLLNSAAQGRCTPFLGAGACYGALPLGSDVAREWAREYAYPLADDGDLIRVAQYVAVQYDPTYPKELILRRFGAAAPPDFRTEDEPHGVLADLPLPVYMTTNYDDFMVRALKDRYRDPRRETCRWNDLLKGQPSAFDPGSGYQPTPANPLVFHLHGHTDPESLVLTEDDYITFLTALGEPTLLPEPVRAALARSTLLFIGYRLADWNIRALLSALRKYRRRSVAVLLSPEGPGGEKARDYLDRYYQSMDLRVYWGTARQFCAELGRRWRERQGRR